MLECKTSDIIISNGYAIASNNQKDAISHDRTLEKSVEHSVENMRKSLKEFKIFVKECLESNDCRHNCNKN